MAAGNGSISDLFWLALATIFLISCVFVLIHYVNFRRRIGAVKSLIKGRRKEGLAESRREVNASAAALRDRTAGALWREFDESLVASTDQTLLYNTLDAEHFFNGRTMARGLTASRLLAAAPSFLVAIGVLGTFVGLSFGLVGLDVSSDDIGELRDGINQMIKGASLAFLTSVWGVFLSLLLNFGEKLAERSALQRTHKLQQEIDFLYPRIPAEQSLVHIADSSRESSDALKHLHEKIGLTLQETMQSMSAEMQSAIADSITKVMGPAIEALSNSANTQSSELIEKLMQRFIDAIGARGEGAAKDLGNAGDKVGSAVSDLREQIKSLTSLTVEQQGAAAQATKELHELMARQIKEQSDAARSRETELTDRMSALMKDFIEQAQQQTDSSGRADEARVERARKMMDDMMASMSERDSGLNTSLKDTLAILAASAQASQQGAEKIMSEQSSLIERLSSVTAGVSESSRQMAGASTSLSTVTASLRSAAEQLGERAAEVSREVHAAATRNQDVSAAAERHLALLGQLQESLSEAARRTEEAAKLANSGYANLEQHQKEFLQGVSKEFTGLGEGLRAEVQSIEKQASQWLNEYSSTVHAQVNERMSQWNQTTVDYAAKMHSLVASISSVVSDLEERG